MNNDLIYEIINLLKVFILIKIGFVTKKKKNSSQNYIIKSKEES